MRIRAPDQRKGTLVTRRIGLILTALVLVVSACAGSASTDTESDSDTATTTSVASNTTTSSTPATATTAAPPEVTTTLAATSDESPEVAALRAAFAASAEVTSGRMEGSIEVTGLDPSQGITEMVMPFGGAFDNASGDSSFYMDMSGIAGAGGDDIPAEFADLLGEMEVRQIGDTAYVKFPFFNMFLGAETPWIAMPADESDPTGGFSMTSPGNPSEILESFEEAGATVEVIGTETVNGVNTTHYRAVFDMEKLLAEATPAERERLEAQGPLPSDAMPMDVWISDDGLVVRFVMDIDGSAVETEPGESFDRMVMRYDMLNLNEAVAIEPPPASEVTHVDDLDAAFGFDLEA